VVNLTKGKSNIGKIQSREKSLQEEIPSKQNTTQPKGNANKVRERKI
jgi:hypothetical protein